MTVHITQVKNENCPKHGWHDILSKIHRAWFAPDVRQKALGNPCSLECSREWSGLNLGFRPTLIVSRSCELRAFCVHSYLRPALDFDDGLVHLSIVLEWSNLSTSSFKMSWMEFYKHRA